MEDLNKNQIILLTLLVSFVTSIATGIMTVSLLQEAPVEVTRTINNVVEKTIETVKPVMTSSTVQKEVTTVVVKEEDRIVDSINKNTTSVVRINERNPFTDERSFYGIGIVISKDGFIATDRKTVLATNIYTATLGDGTLVKIIPQGINKQTNFILFAIDPTEKTKPSLSPAALSDVDAKLGQTVISLGGDKSDAVTVGRIISIDSKDSQVGSTTVKKISEINTDVATKDLVVGSPLFNLSGEIIGMKLTYDPLKSFTPVSVLRSELNSLIEQPKEESKAQ